MLKILSIFGTRPEAIKMAPVIRELEKNPADFKSIVCVTAQHREMLDQVLSLFAIKPDYDLDIMKPNQDLFDITCNVLQGIKNVLEKELPDIVLVHGDTTTTMAATIASYYCKLRVGHVEAGLRTNNKFSPYPEEINRKVVSSIADLHFSPTIAAKQNLIKEGVASEDIFVTGNTVVDALIAVSNMISENTEMNNRINNQFTFLDPNKRMILVTGHRRENFGAGFENICNALAEISKIHSDVEILYPVHLNPKVQEPVKRILSVNQNNIHLIDPVDYLPFVYLMNRSYMIITDSGGVQEEAPSLGKPVLVLREVTERPEAVAAGTVRLVGTDSRRIIAETCQLLNDDDFYCRMSLAHNPYGDGNSAKNIVDILLNQSKRTVH